MYFDIVDAKYLKDYKIKLKFSDGSEGTADLLSYVDKDTVFKAFMDFGFFKNFQIEYGTLVWGNGELDIAPETLYTIATGKPIKYFSQNRAIS